MAQIDGQNFDVRVVCVHGKPVGDDLPAQLAPDDEPAPGRPARRLRPLPGRRSRRGTGSTRSTTAPTRPACFDSAVAGVDLLFERGFRRHYVLEVNAFGDFFPGWTDARGRSVHALEIEATAPEPPAGWRVMSKPGR